MRAYLDKETGLWKWGSNGKAIYETKQQAERAGLDILFDRLSYVKDRLKKAIDNHGK